MPSAARAPSCSAPTRRIASAIPWTTPSVPSRSRWPSGCGRRECDIYYNLETYWGTVQSWVEALLTWRGVSDLLAEEIAVLPGMEELANLLWITRHVESGDFDVVIVDCAPNG